MQSVEKENTQFEIPEDLIVAIEMSSFERQLPRQGAPVIHKFLMDPDNEDAKQGAENWIMEQQALWPEVDRVVSRLQEIAPVASLPEWHHQPWWMKLTMPWSNDLSAAVAEADAWCDKRENG